MKGLIAGMLKGAFWLATAAGVYFIAREIPAAIRYTRIRRM